MFCDNCLEYLLEKVQIPDILLLFWHWEHVK